MRDRIRELRRVRAGDLLPHPANWRRHGEAQRSALSALLGRIGFAAALVVREIPEGLQLVDGHLRAGIDADAEVPVLVVDLTDQEADLVLSTFDPIAEMAGADREALEALLAEAGGDARALAEAVLPATAPDSPEPEEGHRRYRCPRCGREWEGSPRPEAGP